MFRRFGNASPIESSRGVKMFGDGGLTFQEFAMREPLPLSTIHAAVLSFLRGRDDAVLFGAQAVNAYVEQARMTQDVDVLSTRAAALAGDIRVHLASRFHIAVRVRKVADGQGHRLFQLQKPRNRHLVDVRAVAAFPPNQIVEQVRVVTPAELVASKVLAIQSRSGQPKSFTDRRDVAVLLLRFPELKKENGPVRERLKAAQANASTLATWREIVAQPIIAEDMDSGY